MPKKIKYELSEDELTTVRRAIASDKRPEVRHRTMALHLLHQGRRPDEVAEMLAVTVGSIYKWHARWRQDGLDGLANQPRSGRAPKAEESYWQRVSYLIDQDPRELGNDFTMWTAKRLIAQMAKETGITLSISRFRVVLKKRGYVYRRPKHDLKSLQDPEARAVAEEQLSELKKRPWPVSLPSSLWTKPP